MIKSVCIVEIFRTDSEEERERVLLLDSGVGIEQKARLKRVKQAEVSSKGGSTILLLFATLPSNLSGK